MMHVACSLKNHYSVGIITVNKKDRMDHLRQHQRLADVFAPIIVSAEGHHTKASRAIFACALSRLSLHPRESVFIDNTASSLRAPAAIGIKTVYFDDERNDVPGRVRCLSGQFGISADGR